MLYNASYCSNTTARDPISPWPAPIAAIAREDANAKSGSIAGLSDSTLR